MYENIKRGLYNVGDRGCFYFRSKTEANYALYLQSMVRKGEIKTWFYEPQLFEFKETHGVTSYTPDFKVVRLDDSHYWVETKGVMDNKSAKKLRRFKRDFPQEKLELVNYKDYLGIEREFGKQLNFY